MTGGAGRAVDHRTRAVVVSAAFVVAGALTSCASSSPDDARDAESLAPSSSPAPDRAGSPLRPLPTSSCVEGEVIVTPADLIDGTSTVPACRTVIIRTDHTFITLGAVGTLRLEGTGNDIRYEGSTPALLGEISTNTVRPLESTHN
jgi:hypothetical protein